MTTPTRRIHIAPSALKRALEQAAREPAGRVTLTLRPELLAAVQVVAHAKGVDLDLAALLLLNQAVDDAKRTIPGRARAA